MGVLK